MWVVIFEIDGLAKYTKDYADTAVMFARILEWVNDGPRFTVVVRKQR